MNEKPLLEQNCPDCGGPIAIRNPTGKCDHLYYPDMKAKKSPAPTLRAIVEWKLQLIRDTTDSQWVKEMDQRCGGVCFCNDGTCWCCGARAALALESKREEARRELVEAAKPMTAEACLCRYRSGTKSLCRSCRFRAALKKLEDLNA